MADGIAEISWGGKPYTISKSLIEDGRKMQLLNKGPNSIPIECPVRLIQVRGPHCICVCAVLLPVVEPFAGPVIYVHGMRAYMFTHKSSCIHARTRT